jgi:glycosyltransferase involved in cell wall biosynthesis
MSELLEFNWTLHGLFHAGSWDKEDFLGRLIGNEPWVRHAEKSFFWAFDHNYFATDFHINMFVDNLLNNGFKIKEWISEDIDDLKKSSRIVRTGWPMEYMDGLLTSYKNMSKRDLILFPHRIAPEKQVEIFRDLKNQLPQYEFVVCQDQELTKNEYHNLLGEAKIVFSANLQETLGISCYEGCVVDAIPMVPDRLSYTEMYMDDFKYPSEWTENLAQYKEHRKKLCEYIIETMDSYEEKIPLIRKQTENLTENFFSCQKLLKNF